MIHLMNLNSNESQLSLQYGQYFRYVNRKTHRVSETSVMSSDNNKIIPFNILANLFESPYSFFEFTHIVLIFRNLV
jgi:hypothetical protein